MPTICTSCGVQIPPSLIIYKCRQCVHHFICQLCEKKDHNRGSATFHTLEKIFVPNIPATQSVAAPPKIDNHPRPVNSNIRPNSSIFNSDAYLYTLLGFCDHCYRFFGDKETYFACEQCPNNFAVCSKCYPSMSSHHPSVHTFSQRNAANSIANRMSNFEHIGVSCDGCSKESFSGKRYRCEECPPSYDLCENCYGKQHTHHQFKYIQHPALHANNQHMLALRTTVLAEKNGNQSQWRDPLTGWTKSDAEQILQKAKQEQENYDKRFQDNMDRLQALSLQAQMNLHQAQMNLQQTISDGYRRMAWW